jgi:hypothetical protein
VFPSFLFPNKAPYACRVSTLPTFSADGAHHSYLLCRVPYSCQEFKLPSSTEWEWPACLVGFSLSRGHVKPVYYIDHRPS